MSADAIVIYDSPGKDVSDREEDQLSERSDGASVDGEIPWASEDKLSAARLKWTSNNSPGEDNRFDSDSVEDTTDGRTGADATWCLSCVANRTRCDRRRPTCQACHDDNRNCTYETMEVRNSARPTSTPATKTLVVTLKLPQSNASPSKDFATELPTSLLQLVQDWKYTQGDLPEYLFHKAPNQNNIQSALWINAEGEKLTASRRKIDRDVWITIVESQGRAPCIVGIRRTYQLDSFHYSPYTIWRGVSGLDSRPSVFKVVLRHSIPIPHILQAIQQNQQNPQAKRIHPESPQMREKRKLSGKDQNKSVKLAKYAEASLSTAELIARLPGHLRTLVQEYVEIYPDERPLKCANLCEIKKLFTIYSGAKASWTSKDGEFVTIEQYSLGEYGWVIVASSVSFLPQIVKYRHCTGHHGYSGTSCFFGWHGINGWDDSPSVFKYPEGKVDVEFIKSHVGTGINGNVNASPGSVQEVSRTKKSTTTDFAMSEIQTAQEVKPINISRSQQNTESSQLRYSTGSIPSSRNVTQISASDPRTVRNKPRHSLSQGTEITNPMNNTLMVFHGTRTRRRAFTFCDTAEQLLRQVKAAGLFEGQEDDGVLLCKLSTGKEFAIVRAPRGGLDELDVDELAGAIREYNPESVDVMPLV